MENPKSKPTASYFIFIFDREANSNAWRSFFFLRKPGQDSKLQKSLFQVPEPNIYMLVSLHFSRMTVEYRLGAVRTRHVQECNRNQRSQHTSQILSPKSCQAKVKLFLWSSSATALLIWRLQSLCLQCELLRCTSTVRDDKNQLFLRWRENAIYANLPA